MITVFTIVYNNYGHFIPQWIEYMKKQTVIPEMIIVLGKNHGANIEYLKDNNIKYILCDSDNMGKLRNAGLKKVKTEWWLYFSVDDELLPNACEYIINQNSDAISIKFDAIEPDGSIRKNCLSPCINSIKELNNWKHHWGGYVAIKGNKDLRFNENIEVPNLTMHFELFRRGLKINRTNESLIIHHRWDGSHHFINTKMGKCTKFVDEIETTKREVLKEFLLKQDEFKNKNGELVEVIKPCFYINENKQCIGGDYLIIETEERLNDLINRGYVKLI